MSILSSLVEAAVSEVFVVMEMKFVAINIIEFPWSASSGGRSRFSKASLRLSSVSSFSTRTGEHLVITVVPTMVPELL